MFWWLHSDNTLCIRLKDTASIFHFAWLYTIYICQRAFIHNYNICDSLQMIALILIDILWSDISHDILHGNWTINLVYFFLSPCNMHICSRRMFSTWKQYVSVCTYKCLTFYNREGNPVLDSAYNSTTVVAFIFLT